MIHPQNTKLVQVILPQEIGTTEVTGTFDILGFDYATVIFDLDTASASSVITSAALDEATASNGSYTAIAAFAGGTAWTFPTPNTNTGDLIAFHVNTVPRKRYLSVGFASTTARLASVHVMLSRAHTGPDSDTERGATTVVG